jgi:hypothetical protein
MEACLSGPSAFAAGCMHQSKVELSRGCTSNGSQLFTYSPATTKTATTGNLVEYVYELIGYQAREIVHNGVFEGKKIVLHPLAALPRLLVATLNANIAPIRVVHPLS